MLRSYWKELNKREKMDKLSINKALVDDIKSLIELTKQKVSQNVNSSLTLMYWTIGTKINSDITDDKDTKSIKVFVATVSQQLQKHYGKGYSYSALTRMMKFAKHFDEEAVATLSQQVTWSHFMELIPLEDKLKQAFYTQMSVLESWSVRVLRDRINSMLYERTALSKKPKELIKHEIEQLKDGKVSSSTILKDPYILDFLELDDRYLEKDLEDAILREIEQFVLELGSGFGFIARQKRIIIDGEDFKIDLLFYNRKLKRLIAMDLKIGKFKASYKGQMELYLKWLEKHEKEEGENSPLGIILCADKQSEQIELLELDKSNIHVAQYLTVLPAKELLESKLHQAVQNARLKYKVDENE